MVQALIPPIGTSGIFRLNAPFSADLQSGMSYRCEAIRRVIDFVEAGLDVYEEIYLPKGLSRAQYEQDAANQVAIISLVASSGHFVFVPSTYILAYPDIGGVPYTVMVLGLELGSIPNYMNLSGLKSVLSNAVRDTIGVTPQIREVAVSAVQKLSQADHDVLENARKVLITNTQTDRAKAIDYEARFNALQLQHQQLQEWVKQNMPPPA
jgi:hypothetical protein